MKLCVTVEHQQVELPRNIYVSSVQNTYRVKNPSCVLWRCFPYFIIFITSFSTFHQRHRPRIKSPQYSQLHMRN